MQWRDYINIKCWEWQMFFASYKISQKIIFFIFLEAYNSTDQFS